MRKALLLVALIALSVSVHALKVVTTTIYIQVDQDGYGKFREDYSLVFSSPFEFEDFKEKARKNSSSRSAWEADYNFFYPHFEGGTGNAVDSSTITFDEQSRNLTLEYTLKEKFSRLVSQEQRVTSFVIDDKQFNNFIQGASIAVPENTLIVIDLPSTAQVDPASILPPQIEQKFNQIRLRGFQTNLLSIQYMVIKPIAPKGDEIVQGISNIYLALVTVLLILGYIVYRHRGEIEKGIENYLVEHSEIKVRETEEEIDFDLD